MSTNDTTVIWERGQEGGKTRPVNTHVLFKNLVEVCRTLEKYEVRYWISHGTMLGLYRDKSVIPWDDDADIGLDLCCRGKINPALDELRGKGFFIPPEGDRSKPISAENMPYYDTVFIRDGEKVEGWWFEREEQNGEAFYTYDKTRCKNDLKHSAKFYDKLGNLTVNGEQLAVPNHIEDWLVMMYGNDWKTPQQNRKYNNQV